MCTQLHKRVSNGGGCEEEYRIAWENYKAQKNKVKYLTARAKIGCENKKVKELREKGEEGGKKWHRYLRGDKSTNEKVSELIANGMRVYKREEIYNEVKKILGKYQQWECR